MNYSNDNNEHCRDWILVESSQETWTAKQYHLKCQNELGFEKAPNYIKYLHDLFPGKVLHHLLGSASARKKFTDYLVVPLTIEEHAKVHKNLPFWFMMYLPKAIKLLNGYVIHLEDKLNGEK